ncbi:MAG TPA: phosphate signaling complex protein PhoU, partial [Actinobacteria bacterium]|nr:phosphate signaling complex protein PhoU [Actinomycetes bacterium]HEX21497.1 phosphate signaling complex protein PhoU [Actinomycetota bacterium]
LNLEIEKESMYVIARQCPVAGDLRLVFSILFISIHLERMGDLSLNMAKIARRTNEEESLPRLLDLISKMGDQVRLVVKTSLEAFEKSDVELARTLPKLDDPIDDYFKTFFKELASVAAKKGTFEWASNMVLASRYLERIADHAVDIGELITYLVTGVKEEWD